MKLILIPALLLAGCAGTPPPVIVEKIVEVKVEVPVPCLSAPLPTEPVPLRDRYSYDEWTAMGTAEREALVLAQGLDRRVYGDQATSLLTGCTGL